MRLEAITVKDTLLVVWSTNGLETLGGKKGDLVPLVSKGKQIGGLWYLFETVIAI